MKQKLSLLVTTIILMLAIFLNPSVEAQITDHEGIFNDGDVYRLKMQDKCIDPEGNKINLKLKKQHFITFGHNGAGVVTNKDDVNVGGVYLDTNGNIVTGTKNLTLFGKGKKGEQYLCVGTMWGRISKNTTNKDHAKTIKGNDLECCWLESSRIVNGYRAEEMYQNDINLCYETYNACKEGIDCCLPENADICNKCSNQLNICTEGVINANSVACRITKNIATDSAQTKLSDCITACPEDKPEGNVFQSSAKAVFIEDCLNDCNQTCEDTYKDKITNIEAEYLLCSGQVAQVCTQYLLGDLRHIELDEEALICRSSWKLKYKKKYQSNNIVTE